MRALPLIKLSRAKSFGAWSRIYSGNPKPDLRPIPKRLQELKDRLERERQPYVFEISLVGKDLLKQVSSDFNPKYSRGASYEGYVDVQACDSYYLKHALDVPKEAKEPNPIFKIVMPDAQEVADLSGEIDPSNQNRYSPLPGLLFKYEMLLAMVAINCSSHCRYCYRLDLFNGSSGKSKADMPLIAAYIKTFNQMIDDTIEKFGIWDKDTATWFYNGTKEPLIHVREILFSGGDPMTLPNATIAR
jgi:hypothetical protein